MRERIQFAIVILGGFLLLLPNGLFLYWGNLSMYTFSYIMAMNTIPESIIGAPWLSTSFATLWLCGMPMGGLIVKLFGRRAMLMFSVLVFNLSLGMSYFIINTSALTLMLFLGLVGGLGAGLPHGLIMEITAEVAPTGRVGISSVVVQNAVNIGAAVINQLITNYINPDYLVSDWTVGPNSFFSQAKINNRVPSMYVLLCIGSAIVQFAGICLLWKYCSAYMNSSTRDSIKCQNDIATSYNSTQQSVLFQKYSNTESDDLCNYKSVTEKNSTIRCNGTKKHDMEVLIKQLRKALKIIGYCFLRKHYYILFFASVINGINFAIIPSYYKVIGRRGFANEIWLTSIGTIALIFIIPISILFGIIFDKFGAKLSLILLFSFQSISTLFYSMSPYVGVSPYFLMSILIIGLTNSLDYILTPSAVDTLGLQDFPLKLGLIRMSALCVNPAMPRVVSFILIHLGYDFLFVILGTCNVVCLFVVLFW